MGLLVYYSSATGNTHHFVSQLTGHHLRLQKGERDMLVPEPFVLVMPTYAGDQGIGAVPKSIIHMLNIEQNRTLLRGVIGGGNRNFGEMFAIGARVVAQKCAVPCLYKFELRGTDEDVQRVNEGLEKFWKQ